MDATTPPAGPAAGDDAGLTQPAGPPSVGRDVGRCLACGLLTAMSVAAPASAPFFAPFVPVLVAVRCLRHRATARRFLLMATVASLVLGVAGATGAAVLPALAAVLLLVPFLGLEHVRAVRHDPVDAEPQPEWPEPRLTTGFSRAVLAWSVATALVAAALAPLVDSPRTLARDLARDGYSFYTRECADGGQLDAREDFCERILDQRDSVVEAVDDRAPELFAAVAAIFAFGGAATAHLLVLRRARPHSARVRPGWRLRDLEVHWGAAYLVAVGIALALLADGSSQWLAAPRALGVGLATLGALLITSQGLGLAAWLLTRGRTPGWYRAFLVVAAVLFLNAALPAVFVLGVIDLAARPRRRAAASGSLPGRGSGS